MSRYPTTESIQNAKGDDLYALAQKYNIKGRKDMHVEPLRQAIIKRIKYIRMTEVVLREMSKEGLKVVHVGRKGMVYNTKGD